MGCVMRTRHIILVGDVPPTSYTYPPFLKHYEAITVM